MAHPRLTFSWNLGTPVQESSRKWWGWCSQAACQRRRMCSSTRDVVGGRRRWRGGRTWRRGRAPQEPRRYRGVWTLSGCSSSWWKISLSKFIMRNLIKGLPEFKDSSLGMSSLFGCFVNTEQLYESCRIFYLSKVKVKTYQYLPVEGLTWPTFTLYET